MRVTFLGVGEACDEHYSNTSILVETRAGAAPRSLLLDCGFSAAHSYFAHSSAAEALDAVWISHFHGDHFFGAPLLMLRFWEMGRRKPLYFLGQQGLAEKLSQAMDLAYPGFRSRLAYPLHFQEMEPGKPEPFLGLTWQTAENGHSTRDLAIRIDDGVHSLFYSGDGKPTAGTESLAAGCDLVIHEAYELGAPPPGHGSIEGCLEFARRTRTRRLAIVHVQRRTRAERRQEVLAQLQGPHPFTGLLPEPGDILEL